MYSLLSLLFGFGLAVLVYGLSFLPAASLTPSEEPDELASPIDRDDANPVAENDQALSSGPPPESAA